MAKPLTAEVSRLDRIAYLISVKLALVTFTPKLVCEQAQAHAA
jgi:hypothetical protein